MILKDTSKIFKKSSLEDLDKKNIKNNLITKIIHDKKSKETFQKNNNKSIHDSKSSAGNSLYYKKKNENKIQKKNPFEDSLLNTESKKSKK